jgi:hypothetical protein
MQVKRNGGKNDTIRSFTFEIIRINSFHLVDISNKENTPFRMNIFYCHFCPSLYSNIRVCIYILKEIFVYVEKY